MTNRSIIGIEGDHLLVERVGMGHYMGGLLEALSELNPQEKYLVFTLGRSSRLAHRPVIAENVAYRVRPFPRRIHDRLLLAGLAPPTELLIGCRPDVCIWPNFVSWPTLPGVRNVVVIHDLCYLLHGQYLTTESRRYYETLVPRSIRRADHVIAVSANVKRELMEHLGLPEGKVTIVTPAVRHADFYPRSDEEIRHIEGRYGLNRPYILYTGTLEPRKNIMGLLEAYAGLPSAVRERFQLVLAGGKGWLDSEITGRLKELRTLPIVLTGYVPDADLPALYSGAALFVYPSFYEGFGMPPLEAMACGVPVITSDSASLPEVVGDAAVTVAASDISSLRRAIENLLEDEELAGEMRDRGLIRASQFSWKQSAMRLHEVLCMPSDGIQDAAD
jgi:glycosyltransferase involved in cell wall biosynthesis